MHMCVAAAGGPVDDGRNGAKMAGSAKWREVRNGGKAGGAKWREVCNGGKTIGRKWREVRNGGKAGGAKWREERYGGKHPLLFPLFPPFCSSPAKK
jgi:hypothetical protein